MDDYEALALEMARRHMAMPVTYHIGETDHRPLCVAGIGAGFLMAFCDWARSQYPWMSLIATDLPGAADVQQRMGAVDYLATVFPTVLLLWSSIRPASGYAELLLARDLQVAGRPAWLYLRGLGEDDWAPWTKLGFQRLDKPFAPKPLGPDDELRARMARHEGVTKRRERLKAFEVAW